MMFMALPKAPASFRTVKTMTKWSSSFEGSFSSFENTANLVVFPPDSFMWESRILRPCFSAASSLPMA